jgi:type IV pilus assembly protein PilA
MSWLRAIVAKQEPEFPRRNIISFLLSLFVPSVGISRSGGGIVNLMVVVAIIGILSAIALPAYQSYVNTANAVKVSPAFEYREEIYEAMNPYIVDKSELPFSLEQIGLSSHPPVEVIESLAIVESRIILTLTTRFSGEEDTIVLIPYVEEGELVWSCSQGTLDEKYRPEECQQ